jgi:hypothetical protein
LDTDINDSNKTFRDDKYTVARFVDTEQFTEGSSYRRDVFLNIIENYIEYNNWNVDDQDRAERIENLKNYIDIVPKIVLNVFFIYGRFTIVVRIIYLKVLELTVLGLLIQMQRGMDMFFSAVGIQMQILELTIGLKRTAQHKVCLGLNLIVIHLNIISRIFLVEHRH